MEELVLIGKIVSTFGIKGELKVISDFKYIDKAYIKGNVILINNINYVISSVRYHKKYILITINDINDINLVLEYIGYNIYIKLSDLKLGINEYLDSDLIDSKVIDNNIVLGSVIEVIKGNINDLIRVKGDSEFLIPLVDRYIIKIDKLKKEIITKDAKDLIL